ncbi:hypothetical protein B9Z55_024182 [Caenorhabditis nigoni]|uniref:Uncharacterized protein n=1 Tax=Caenorhabditis nigoni TaxID=1611254 RepID=A0A2G5SST6_9PELO|nr:hypothetical protein B9Z55_024182 [Caenorhabditis nigoni]
MPDATEFFILPALFCSFSYCIITAYVFQFVFQIFSQQVTQTISMPGANSGKMNRGKASSMAAKNSFRPTQASKKQPVIRSEKEIQEIRTKAKKKSERAEQELVQLKLSGFEDAIKRSLHLLEIVQVNRGDSKKEREVSLLFK